MNTRRIIPADLKHQINVGGNLIEKLLRESGIHFDRIEVKRYNEITFVDCGSNLDKIYCPVCNQEIKMEWWQQSMSISHVSSFLERVFKTDCCDKNVSLEHLKYDFDCGFATSEIEVLNPSRDFTINEINSLEKQLGFNIKVIHQKI